MGRSVNVAFCTTMLIYCSLITGDYRCVSSATAVRRDGVSNVTAASTLQLETHITNHTQPLTNGINSIEPTPGMVANSSTPVLNNTGSINGSDASPMNNTTPTTLLQSTTHKPTNSTHIATVHPSRAETIPQSTSAYPRENSSTAAAVSTQMSTSSSPVQPKTHADTPSALNIGDGDSNRASTDPLLAGLVSAFVVVAAIVSVLIFLKIRNRNNGPRFRRLQDLPMDDMLEDAPLSMYSY